MTARNGSQLLHERIEKAARLVEAVRLAGAARLAETARLAEAADSVDEASAKSASTATSNATTSRGRVAANRPVLPPVPESVMGLGLSARSAAVTPHGGVDQAALNTSVNPWDVPVGAQKSVFDDQIDTLFPNERASGPRMTRPPALTGETAIGDLGSFPAHSSDQHQTVKPTLESRLRTTFDTSGVRASWVFTFSETPDFVAYHSEDEEFGSDRVKRLVARTVGRAAPLLEKQGERMIHADLGSGCRLYCRKLHIDGADHIIGMAGATSDMSTAKLNPLVGSLQDEVAQRAK